MKKDIKVSPKFIKEYLEEVTELDLTSKKRDRHLCYTRYVCFALCRGLTNRSLAEIGSLFNRDHATVLNGLKRFEEHKDQVYFEEYFKIYQNTIIQFKKLTVEIPKLKSLSTSEELKIEYDLKIDKIISKYRAIINKQNIKLNRYETVPVFGKISELPENEFNELLDRINEFLIMNACNSKRQLRRKKMIRDAV